MKWNTYLWRVALTVSANHFAEREIVRNKRTRLCIRWLQVPVDSNQIVYLYNIQIEIVKYIIYGHQQMRILRSTYFRLPTDKCNSDR